MSRLLLVLIGLAFVWGAVRLARALRHAVPERQRRRAEYFAAAAPLLSDLVQRIEPSGFPRIAGTHAGLRFDLQALPDTLTFRKLPTLWVMVTLTAPQDLRGETHVMARPRGQEGFSRIAQMPVQMGLPPGFPPDTVLRCSAADAIPPPPVMARLAALFQDPLLKEAVLSPRGLRLVTLGDEADRTAYLLFRDAELGTSPFPAQRLADMLDALTQLHQPPKAPA